MITLITGAPGAGKTCALVDLLTKECQRRAVYVDGIPALQVPHVSLDEPRNWMAHVEDGAAVVIDEVQRVWRPRGSASAVPADVAALETHRHRGLDFYLVTQHPNLLDANVRRLVGRHVHLRDVGLLGRWWYEWPEATNPEQFRQAPIKKRYALSKKAFGLYKSASLHVKPIRSVPRALVLAVVAVVALGGLSYRAFASISSKTSPASQAATPSRAQGQPASAAVVPVASAASVALPSAAAVPPPPRVVGCIASASKCSCFDSVGRVLVLEWKLCQTSASGYGGVVPIAMDTSPAGLSAGAASAPAPVVEPPASAGPAVVSLGGDSRAHVRP